MTERERKLLERLRDTRYWCEHFAYTLCPATGLTHVGPTLAAMQGKGLVTRNQFNSTASAWCITDAGRAALAAEEARDG